MTLYTPGMPIIPRNFDVMLFLLGEETLLTRDRGFLDWAKPMGNFHGAMDRHWHDVPPAMISFGYSYMLYDEAWMPCYINAYATMPSMQAAVVDCV